MAHRHVTYEASGDVDQLQAHCDVCGELRLFTKESVDFSAVEAAAPVPDVRRALEGETGWVCSVCGGFRRTLVADQAYPVAFANVGAVRESPEEDEQGRHREGVSDDLQLRAMSDAEETIHEAATEGAALREDPAAMVDEVAVDDPALERAILDDVAAQERGEQDLALPSGPRRPMPPPARIPARDPTDPEG